MDAPVRLCCGQRHIGVECPDDGSVQCCLCFKRFAPDELHVTDDGTREDVCNGCAVAEVATKTKGGT